MEQDVVMHWSQHRLKNILLQHWYIPIGVMTLYFSDQQILNFDGELSFLM